MRAALLLCASVGAAQACKSAADCSMLGECVVGGCVCDRGFAGTACDLLDLGAAPPAGVMRSNSTWGGRAVYSEHDRRWHMYASDVGPCGLHNFQSFSRVIHLSGDAPEGPFAFEGEVAPSMAHNAYPVVTPRGELLVYYIGKPFNAGTLSCDDPPTAVNATSVINVAHSPSGHPNGPWTHHLNILEGMCPAGGSWCQYVSNPAPLVLANGTTLISFHGRDNVTPKEHNGDEAPGIGIGESWKGPFRLLNPKPIFQKPAPWYNTSTGELQPPAEFHGEDFFMWKGRRAYHMLWHVKKPFAAVPDDWKASGVLSWSDDGRDWTPCGHLAYNKSLTWASEPNPGTLTSRQRPLLLFADRADPFRPTQVFFGAQKCPRGSKGPEDYSWNMVVPFN